ncbi:MAG: hypothetical protein E7191_03845 [Erysipelotrichaceae bacterium]|nr:hypothetical protein [Erysipelotrichaceae bacterium]
MRKYLYSLIWYDDPTQQDDSNELGSILRICAAHDFDKVYLVRAEEVRKLSNFKLKETRLKEILKDKGCNVEISDLPSFPSSHVGKWKDAFYHSISSCLKRENDEDILWYVNFSNGTPIMISALTQAILMINQPLFAIYPQEKVPTVNKKYDVSKKKIISNMENCDTQITISSISHLQESALRADIEHLINIYDYQAAAVLLSQHSSTYYKTLENMCIGAHELMRLEIDSARKTFAYTPLHTLFKTKIPKDILRLILYVNNLQIKCEKEEYFDFVLRSSPLLYELCFLILTEYTHFPKEAIYSDSNYSTELIKRKSLPIIPTEFKRFFENYFVKNPQADHIILTTPLLIHLVSYQLTSSLSITHELAQLRSFEEKIRNEFAHVFSNYSEEYIKERTGVSPQEILDLYKKVIRKIAYKHINEEINFDVYSTINSTIMEYMDIVKED